MDWSPKEEIFLKENYKTMEKKILLKKLKRSWEAIRRKSARLNAGHREERETRYTVNKNYFSKITTDRQAYMLGLLWSDGFLVQNYFGIHLIDRDVLEWIKKELKYTGKIEIIKAHHNNLESYSLRISNHQLINDLKELGFHQKKSWTIRFPNLDERLNIPFICGIFDGDGSIHIPRDQKRRSHRRINIAGNPQMIAKIKEILISLGFPETKTKIERCGTHVLQYVSSRVELFWKKLYRKSPYRMRRKEKKFLDNEIVQKKELLLCR